MNLELYLPPIFILAGIGVLAWVIVKKIRAVRSGVAPVTFGNFEHLESVETIAEEEGVQEKHNKKKYRSKSKQQATQQGFVIANTTNNVTAKISVSGKKNESFEDVMIERIALNPRDIEAYERLGAHYMEHKHYADAKECYKQVIRMSPQNSVVRKQLRCLERLLKNKKNES